MRKRAIKIIKDMCTSDTGFSLFSTACVEIISRINDEESSIQVFDSILLAVLKATFS